MKIYTSYYGKVKNLRQQGILPVAISVGIPKWFNGVVLEQLAPTKQMVFGYSREQYIPAYRKLLERSDIDELRASFKRFSDWSDGKGIALLCWCKPGEFCHRRLFAEWWEEKTGEVIEEYCYKEVAPQTEPLGLFY